MRLPECMAIRLTGDPPGERNEEELHRCAEPERRGGLPEESDTRAGSADIGGEHGDEKHNESESSGASRWRKNQTNGTCDLAETGKYTKARGQGKEAGIMRTRSSRIRVKCALAVKRSSAGAELFSKSLAWSTSAFSRRSLAILAIAPSLTHSRVRAIPSISVRMRSAPLGDCVDYSSSKPKRGAAVAKKTQAIRRRKNFAFDLVEVTDSRLEAARRLH